MESNLKKYLDADGKIDIKDDMPEELKEAIRYFNENNVDIASLDEPIIVSDDEDEVLESFGSDSGESDYNESNTEESLVQEDDLEEDEEETNLDDLESMF